MLLVDFFPSHLLQHCSHMIQHCSAWLFVNQHTSMQVQALQSIACHKMRYPRTQPAKQSTSPHTPTT
jgi:hypothetical protein